MLKKCYFLQKLGQKEKGKDAHNIYIYIQENSSSSGIFKTPPGDSNMQQNLGTTAQWE